MLQFNHLRSLAPKQLGDEYEKYNAPGQAGPLIDDVTIPVVGGQEGTMARMAMGLRHSVNTGHEL